MINDYPFFLEEMILDCEKPVKDKITKVEIINKTKTENLSPLEKEIVIDVLSRYQLKMIMYTGIVSESISNLDEVVSNLIEDIRLNRIKREVPNE